MCLKLYSSILPIAKSPQDKRKVKVIGTCQFLLFVRFHVGMTKNKMSCSSS